jgi:hypothetical protein
MKFYKDKDNQFYFFDKIKNNKLTAIIVTDSFGYDDIIICFFYNGLIHNEKNFANFERFEQEKIFSLKGKIYGDQNDFTKQSWRKFVKLQAFL